MRRATLYGDGTSHTGDDSGEKFQDLGDFTPVYFYHFKHGFSLTNTNFTDYTEKM